jgi:hypothetical protein
VEGGTTINILKETGLLSKLAFHYITNLLCTLVLVCLWIRISWKLINISIQLLVFENLIDLEEGPGIFLFKKKSAPQVILVNTKGVKALGEIETVANLTQ